MKYWMDTEFIERPYTIDLISIGLVAEDGREFYAESSEIDWTRPATGPSKPCARNSRARECRARTSATPFAGFIDEDKHPVFSGCFPAYDWVAFCWLFGGMNDLPFCVSATLPGHQAMGDQSWAIPNCPARRERATSGSPTRGGQGCVGIPGRSRTPPRESDAALDAKILIRSRRSRQPAKLAAIRCCR